MEDKLILICIILYFIIGLIIMLLWNLSDMRGEDFDEDFFLQFSNHRFNVNHIFLATRINICSCCFHL